MRTHSRVPSGTIAGVFPYPSDIVMSADTKSSPTRDVGYHTAIGRVREHNEDSLKIVRECSLFAVADGMGGHLAGERASALAVEVLQQRFLTHETEIDGSVLREALIAASVPELTNRTRSMEGTSARTRSPSSCSRELGAPKLVPSRAAAAIALTRPPGAWP